LKRIFHVILKNVIVNFIYKRFLKKEVLKKNGVLELVEGSVFFIFFCSTKQLLFIYFNEVYLGIRHINEKYFHGLPTAPYGSTFHSSILNLLLQKYLNKGINIYLDDIHI